MKKLILASTSPRRKELMAKIGLPFEAIASNYEEDMTLSMTPENLAKYLSRGKAEAVVAQNPHTIVIGADTFIAFKGKLLGKPHTPEKATETLSMLSGQPHSIITGFTIIDSDSRQTLSEAIETKVYFRELTTQEIEDCVATGEPLDKAGAYAIQGRGKGLVDRIEGDFDNVVGLPVSALRIALGQFETK